jgi:hypothetical protein
VQVRRRNGKLVVVAAVQRLHPRHWDGHRLLQFLTGVALLVLALGTTAASAAPASPAATPVTTTIEAPAMAPAVSGVEAAPADRHSGECQHDASRVARDVSPAKAANTAAEAAANVTAVAGAPADATAEIQAAVAHPVAGIAQRAHGSRAPPR